MRSIRFFLAAVACLLALSSLPACGEASSAGSSTTPRTLSDSERIRAMQLAVAYAEEQIRSTSGSQQSAWFRKHEELIGKLQELQLRRK